MVEWLVLCVGVGLSGVILVIIGRRRAESFAVKTGSKVIVVSDPLVDERAWRLVGGAVTPSASGMLTVTFAAAAVHEAHAGSSATKPEDLRDPMH